jgi:hypothetical protein
MELQKHQDIGLDRPNLSLESAQLTRPAAFEIRQSPIMHSVALVPRGGAARLRVGSPASAPSLAILGSRMIFQPCVGSTLCPHSYQFTRRAAASGHSSLPCILGGNGRAASKACREVHVDQRCPFSSITIVSSTRPSMLTLESTMVDDPARYRFEETLKDGTAGCIESNTPRRSRKNSKRLSQI